MTNNNTPRIQLFLLNGPPCSGKDSLANYVVKTDRTFGKMAAAFPIKEAMRSFFGLSDDEYYQYENNRQIKDVKQDRFGGKSWREVNIAFAEDFVKKTYGQKIFGDLLVSRIKNIRSPKQGYNIIISDCGFTEEVEPLVEEYGADNIHTIKLARKGHTFDIDSRDYIDCEKLGIGEYFLRNTRNEAFYHKNGFSLVQALKAGNLPITTPFSENDEK